MDFSPTSAGLFRDLGGLTAMIQRLRAEVGLADGALGAARDKGKQQPGSGQPEYAVTYLRRLLLKSLLRAIALASYAPGTAARPQVPQNRDKSEGFYAAHVCSFTCAI